MNVQSKPSLVDGRRLPISVTCFDKRQPMGRAAGTGDSAWLVGDTHDSSTSRAPFPIGRIRPCELRHRLLEVIISTGWGESSDSTQTVAASHGQRPFGQSVSPWRNRGLTRFSHHLTVEARNRPAITALRLLAVLNVTVQVHPHYSRNAAPSGARLVLTGPSRTSPRHVVRKAG